jgi:hypothetical protein
MSFSISHAWNEKPGVCFFCGERVPPGVGRFAIRDRALRLIHVQCAFRRSEKPTRTHDDGQVRVEVKSPPH